MFNVLISFISAIQSASKNLMDTLTEVYEPQWTGQDLLTVQGQNSEMLWADLAHKLSDQVLIPLNTYQGQFPEMRKKIEKRGRKLIDYDKERHNVQTLQANPNRNEAKYARYHTYEMIIITFYSLFTYIGYGAVHKLGFFDHLPPSIERPSKSKSLVFDS